MRKRLLSAMLVSIMLIGWTIIPVDAENTNNQDYAMAESETAADMPMLASLGEDSVMLLSTEGETGVLSGRVSLANDVTATGGKIGVNVYKYEKTDGKITARSNTTVAYQSYYLNSNNYIDYSFTLPKGSYAVSAEYYYTTGDAVNYPIYYAGAKSVDSVYGADAVVLSDSATADIVIPKAERVIKGTVTFANAIEEDTHFYVMASDANYTIDGYNYLSVSAGATSAEYTVGVGVGTYNLQVGVDGQYYGWYSIYNTADEWENICYIDTTDAAMEDIDFTYTSDTTNKVLPITVKFSNAATADTVYRVGFKSGDTTVNSGNEKVLAGESEFAANVNITGYKQGYVFVADTTISNSVYSESNAFYYYSEELGITPDISKATLVDFEQTDALTITFPESVVLSGTVSRNGNAVGESIEFSVRADIDGDSFYKTVKLDKDADSAEYALNIPSRYADKTAQVYISLKERGSTRELMMLGEAQNLVVAETMEQVNFDVPSDLFVKTSGTFKLAAAAPYGGVAVTLSSRFKKGNTTISYRNAEFHIPEGQTELSYSTYILNCDETKTDGKINVQVSTISTDCVFDNYKNIKIDPESATGIEIDLVYNNQTLSGKVILPQDITVSSASTYRISASYTYSGTSYYINAYASVKKNTYEADYCMYLPKGATVTNISMYAENIGDCCVENSTLYYTGSGTSTSYTNIDVVADDAITVNFSPKRAKLIRGTITVPSDFTGSAYAWVYAGGSSGSSIRIEGPGEIQYTTSIPLDTTSTTVYLSFSDQYVCNYFTGNTYYNQAGSKYISSEAETVDTSGDLTDNINFTLIEAAVLAGTLTYGEGATYEGDGNVRIYAQGENFSNSAYLRLTSLTDFNYSISVPKAEAESVYVYADLSLYSGTVSNMSAGKYYYKGGQTLSVLESEKLAVNLNNVSTLNLTIPTGYRVSGKLIYPDGAIGTMERGTIYASYSTSTGGSANVSCNVSADEYGNYEVYLPPIDREYKFYLSPTLSGKTNLIGSSYYYVSDNESADSYSAATLVDVSGNISDINFIFEKGSTISGKIILPDGVNYTSGMNVYLYLRKSSPYLYQYCNVALTGKETEYMVAYPSDIGDDIYVYYTSYSNPIYSDYLYYTEDGPTTDEASAALLDAGATNIDLQLAKQGGSVKIKPCRAAGSSGYVSYKIQVITDTGVTVTASSSMSGTATEGSEKTIKIPDFGKTATKYRLAFIMNNKTGYYMTDTAYSSEADEGTWLDINDSTFSAMLPDMENLVSMADMVSDGIKNGSVSVGVSGKPIADSASDELSVTFNCKNAGDLTLVSNVYVGVYKNNALVDIVSHKYEIPQNSSGGSVDVNIPMDISGEYEYRLFMWDGMAKSRPVTDTVTAEVQ